MKRFPANCPCCDTQFNISKLSCSKCKTELSGLFTMPILLQLTEEEQNFILQFVLSSGSLKEMAAHLKVSYPSVRNRLDDLIEKIQNLS